LRKLNEYCKKLKETNQLPNVQIVIWIALVYNGKAKEVIQYDKYKKC
jgi:hypothetical protein